MVPLSPLLGLLLLSLFDCVPLEIGWVRNRLAVCTYLHQLAANGLCFLHGDYQLSKQMLS